MAIFFNSVGNLFSKGGTVHGYKKKWGSELEFLYTVITSKAIFFSSKQCEQNSTFVFIISGFPLSFSTLDSTERGKGPLPEKSRPLDFFRKRGRKGLEMKSEESTW